MKLPQYGEIWRQKEHTPVLQLIRIYIVAVYTTYVLARAADTIPPGMPDVFKIPVSWFLTRYRKETKLDQYLDGMEDEDET
jgi:hypothetical protein